MSLIDVDSYFLLMNIVERIKDLKEKKEVTILAHYYQPLAVQKIADYLGDSLGLSKIAKNKVKTKYILFAGVSFMGETASILNQSKIILAPDITAGCPLSNFIGPKIIKEYKKKYPKPPLVVYVNTTAETKANADICCTSSNALKIVTEIAKEWKTDTVLFGPDKNLAAWVKSQSGLNIITVPPKGNCLVHNQFSDEHIKKAKRDHPGATFLAHPEAPMEILNQVDYVGSTAGMIKFIENEKNKNSKGFVVGTEIGLIEHLNYKHPEMPIFNLYDDAICKNMKKSSLKKVLTALKSIGTVNEGKYEIKVPPEIAEKALISIDKMMSFS